MASWRSRSVASDLREGGGPRWAARAGRVLHSDEWEIEPVVAVVWEDRCISAEGKKCGLCSKACPYGAIEYEQGKAASVITAKCHGCGIEMDKGDEAVWVRPTPASDAALLCESCGGPLLPKGKTT